MIDTFRQRLPKPGEQGGDTLIEVVVAALILGVIVVGTFMGLNSTNKSTSISRARSQADALAQQDEDRLRSLPISALKKLEEENGKTYPVTENGTEFKITSVAKYVVDNTATTSCSTSAPSAEYIETTSTVNATLLGGHSVVETGIVSPPPDTSLIVQVTNDLGGPVSGMEAQATGPAPASTVTSALTSTNGCAILTLSPGEYKLNVHQAGYVDQNWFAESQEDSFYPKSVYLTAETTTKERYLFAPAAWLKPLTFEELNPTTGAHEPAKALNAILENPGMSPTFRLLRPEGSTEYLSTMHTENFTTHSEKIVYPFQTAYTVYAGSCQANKPPEEKEWTTKQFLPETQAEATLVLPSLIVDVWTGTEGPPTTNKGELVKTAPEVFLSDTDEGCEHTYHQLETVTNEAEHGALKYPGQPWGKYDVCVNVTHSGNKEHYIHKEGKEEVENDNPKKEGTVVNLYEGGSGGTGLETGSCP